MEVLLIQIRSCSSTGGFHPCPKHGFTIAASFWREHIVEVHGDFTRAGVTFSMLLQNS